MREARKEAAQRTVAAQARAGAAHAQLLAQCAQVSLPAEIAADDPAELEEEEEEDVSASRFLGKGVCGELPDRGGGGGEAVRAWVHACARADAVGSAAGAGSLRGAGGPASAAAAGRRGATG
jgi:hypothetical protein